MRHNRYKDQPDSTTNEFAYFHQAADRFAPTGARIERIDTTSLDATAVAQHTAALVLQISHDLEVAS